MKFLEIKKIIGYSRRTVAESQTRCCAPCWCSPRDCQRRGCASARSDVGTSPLLAVSESGKA